MTLTEFLLARIAEDEGLAHGVDAEDWGGLDVWGDGKSDFYLLPQGGERWPARVLAECASKREVIGLFQDAGEIPSPDMGWHFLKATLRTMAHVYADHPDFQPEWRP